MKALQFNIKLLLLISIISLTYCRKDEPENIREGEISEAFPGKNGEIIDIVINGDTITCEKINGEYIFQGDIILSDYQLFLSDTTKKGAGIPYWGLGYLWPDGIIYYDIDEDVVPKVEINEAISHIEQYTSIKFVERTNQIWHVTFTNGTKKERGNSSCLGMYPLGQRLYLTDYASKGDVIHELCHAIGLIHEHSRLDRDEYIIVDFDNIVDTKEHNFYKTKTTFMTEYFDFNSIMLYPSKPGLSSFVEDYTKPIITKLDGTEYENQDKELSTGDITAINMLYSPENKVTLPIVITKEPSDIKETQAVVGGQVIHHGYSFVIERGVIWGKVTDPESTYSKLIIGQGSGSFTAELTGLSPETKYNVKAFATNFVGTDYGDSFDFTTASFKPIFMSAVICNETPSILVIYYDKPLANITPSTNAFIVTANSTLINVNSVNVSGDSVSLYLSTPVKYGDNISISYTIPSTNAIQTISGEKAQSFENKKVINLLNPPNSDILFNPNLTYGSVIDIEGNSYKTIQIGTQIWMAENLKTTKLNNNTSIPLIVNPANWRALASPGYCWLNNDESTNKNLYGALYNWYTVNTGKLCPQGWHVPSEPEWSTLISYLGGGKIAGSKLKEIGIRHWKEPNLDATNEFGFTSVPSGKRSPIVYTSGEIRDGFPESGSVAYYWTTTDSLIHNKDFAWSKWLPYYDSEVHWRTGYNTYDGDLGSPKSDGLSVRCIKDLLP